MRSSRYISLVIPKANTSFGRLSFQFFVASDWNKLQKSLKLETYISLTNFKQLLYLSSLPIAAAVYSPSVNSPPNYLPHHLHIYHSSVNLLNCNYFATMSYCLTPFAHTVYRFFYCVIDCTFIYV